MDRAEEAALKIYPQKIEGDSRGSYDLNLNKRIIYQQGYYQAEKDLELTWEDIRDICRMWIESKTPFGVTGEALSIEVLKRFKEHNKL